jgi:hypothetical protein
VRPISVPKSSAVVKSDVSRLRPKVSTA